MSHKVLAGTLLILVLGSMSACGYIVTLRRQLAEAHASATMRDLQLAGATLALEAKPKEIVKFVEKATAPIIKYIKSGEVKPIAGVKIDATSEVVNIPCPMGTVADAPASAAPTIPVTFGIEAQIALSHVPHKGIISTSAIQGMAIGEDWHLPISFLDKETKIDVRVDPAINAALDYYDRSWLKKHTSLVCPGVGVTYNPLDTGRPVNVGVTCTYGFSWF